MVETAQIQGELEGMIRRLRPDLRGQLSSDARLREDIGLDSLHSMELLSRITERYDLDVDVEDLAAIQTVGDVVGFVAKSLLDANRAPSP